MNLKKILTLSKPIRQSGILFPIVVVNHFLIIFNTLDVDIIHKFVLKYNNHAKQTQNININWSGLKAGFHAKQAIN